MSESMENVVLQVGRLVSSTKGRDKGRFYLVVDIEGETRVRVADGEGRKVDNPKRKNVRHLKFYDVIAEELANKARSEKRITSADVRKELKSLIELYSGDAHFNNKEVGHSPNVKK